MTRCHLSMLLLLVLWTAALVTEVSAAGKFTRVPPSPPQISTSPNTTTANPSSWTATSQPPGRVPNTAAPVSAESPGFLDSQTAGLDNIMWIVIIIAIVLVLVLIWCVVRLRKQNKVRRHTHEHFQDEVQKRLYALDEAVMMPVLTAVKKTLPRPAVVKPVRQSSRAAAQSSSQRRGSSPGSPPQSAQRHQDPSTMQSTELVEQISELFAKEIWAVGDDAAALRNKIYTFMKRELLGTYVDMVVRHVYGKVDSALVREGEELFRASSTRTVSVHLQECGEDESTCGWRFWYCLCPGGVQRDVDRHRSRLYQVLLRRFLATGGIDPHKSMSAAGGSPARGGSSPSSSAARYRSGRDASPNGDAQPAPLAAPLVRRHWVHGASVVQATGEVRVAAGIGRKAGTQTGGGKKLQKMDKEMMDVFSSHFVKYIPDTCDSGRPPSHMSDLSPLQLQEKKFAVTAAEDKTVFGCCDAYGLCSLRSDIFLYMHVLKDTIYYSPGLAKKQHFPMYDIVPSFDGEVKAWVGDVASFLSKREALSWRSEFMRRAKLIVNSEEDAARNRIRREARRGSVSSGAEDLSLLEPGSPGSPGVASPTIPSHIDVEALEEQFKVRVLEDLRDPFLKVEEFVFDPPEAMCMCCEHCLPDIPAIRRDIPAGDEALTTHIKALLKEVVLTSCREEEHVSRARRELFPLRKQLLDLLYPESSDWYPRGGPFVPPPTNPGETPAENEDINLEYYEEEMEEEGRGEDEGEDAGGYSPRERESIHDGDGGDEEQNEPSSHRRRRRRRIRETPPRGRTPQPSPAEGYPSGPVGTSHPAHRDLYLTYDDIITENVLQMVEDLEGTVSAAIDRRELSLALDVVQYDPITGKIAKKIAHGILKKYEVWIQRLAKYVTLLKLTHRTAKDICAMGRESAGGVFSEATSIHLMELLVQQRQNILKFLEGGRDFISWLPSFQDVLKSYHYYAEKIGIGEDTAVPSFWDDGEVNAQSVLPGSATRRRAAGGAEVEDGAPPPYDGADDNRGEPSYRYDEGGTTVVEVVDEGGDSSSYRHQPWSPPSHHERRTRNNRNSPSSSRRNRRSEGTDVSPPPPPPRNRAPKAPPRYS